MKIVLHLTNYGTLEVVSHYLPAILKGYKDNSIIKVKDSRGEDIYFDRGGITYFRVVDGK